MAVRPKAFFASRTSFDAHLKRVSEQAVVMVDELRNGDREPRYLTMAEELRAMFGLTPLMIFMIEEFRCSGDQRNYKDRSTGQVTVAHEASARVTYRGSRFFFGRRPKTGLKLPFGGIIGSTNFRLYGYARDPDLREFAAAAEAQVRQMREAYDEYRPTMKAMQAHVDRALRDAFQSRSPGTVEWEPLTNM